MAHTLHLHADVSNLSVGTKDVVFVVRQDGQRFGELRVSKGSLVWRGRYDHIGRKIGWKRFATLMEEHGVLAERRDRKARARARK